VATFWMFMNMMKILCVVLWFPKFSFLCVFLDFLFCFHLLAS
jgi:hypothetical protein